MEMIVTKNVTEICLESIEVVTGKAETIVVLGLLEVKISHPITKARVTKIDTLIDLIDHRAIHQLATIINNIIVTAILINHHSGD